MQAREKARKDKRKEIKIKEKTSTKH